jgi:hypothetical protein
MQSILLLRPDPDMGGAIEGRPRFERLGLHARQRAAELLLDQSEEFLDAEPVEHVFEPRLEPVGAVAVIDEDPHDRVRHRRGLVRLHHHPGFTCEIPVAGDAAEQQAKPDARRDRETVFHGDRLEADIVGVLEHRDDAAAVEPDIELARNAVERTLVEDVEMPFARIGPRVDQLLGIDAGRRSAGDVADIVGTGAARAQAEIENPLHHGDGALRLDLAHLQVGARGDVGVAAAVTLREVGKP